MATGNFGQPSIPHFDGHYNHWSMLMENFLRSKEYWQVVSEGIDEPTNGTVVTEAQRKELKVLRLKDLKAKNYLFQAIDRSILETILCKDTSKHIWDSMKKKYQGSARAKRQQLQTLRLEFKTLRMKSAHVIEELSIDELQSSLQIHERKICQQEKEEHVLKVSTENHSITRGGRGKGNGRGRGGERGNNDCGYQNHHHQHEYGHYESECRVNLNKENRERTNFAKNEEVSLLMLQEKGYEISIKDGVCKIQDEKLGLIAQVDVTPNMMFPLYLHTITNSCFSARMKDEGWLWHFRYGHLNFGGLKTLQQKNMVTGLPQILISSQVCEECVISKQHREPFQKGKSWWARKTLDLVHLDLCGPITQMSNGAYKLYNLITKKIVISRDVVFDEDQFWNWDAKNCEQPIEADFDRDNEDGRQQPLEQVQNEQQAAELANECLHRKKKRPAWMEDYVVEGINEEEVPHFALFSDCDPDQLADIFTKPLKLFPFQKLRRSMGVCTLENSV
ncbi:hypothetical protein HRI_004556900 [Hibiscus trionum]|uniref:GAG-pre-integrase domain-containing protein n=1 Tax=Hibiscus trionum TaxID=183268 RepID=A0A9W7MQC1_HIBTR|nr:hypothetical protein HRI_004556900 [Hibiscus trionum]